MFENYKKNLKPQQLKRFEKILSLYQELRPYYYDDVKIKINKTKTSPNVHEEMHKYNDYIYSTLFDTGKFLREYKGFKIGDKIYIDGSFSSRIIKEFVINNNGVFIIPNDFNFILDNPYMIELISKEERPDNIPSLYQKVTMINIDKASNYTKNVINSEIKQFLKHYSDDEINFNPEYQRDLVWSVDKKQAYIESLMLGKCQLTPTYIYHEYGTGEKPYEVLDGKQRLNAVLSYIRGEFSALGYYYKDLTKKDTSRFLRTPYYYTLIKYHDNNNSKTMPIEQKIELFLQINDYGQKISDEELNKIKEKYLRP